MDDSQLRYGDKTIFKMAFIDILNLLNLVFWSESEHYSTSSYHQILHQSDNKSMRYSQKTMFNMAAGRHIGFAKL